MYTNTAGTGTHILMQIEGTNVTLEGSNYSLCGMTRTHKRVERTSTTPDQTEARDRKEHRNKSLKKPTDMKARTNMDRVECKLSTAKVGSYKCNDTNCEYTHTVGRTDAQYMWIRENNREVKSTSTS